MSKLLHIKNFGQKIWLDNLSRALINTGQLQQLIDQDGIAGVTSNPSIFYKAISSDPLYTNDLTTLKHSGLNLEQRYEALVIPDIQQACDLMLPLYQTSSKEDGYVSFELSPALANNVEGSIENARRLWKTINRPNLMIKIPATTAGNQALEQLISEGININITLLFSLKQVMNTWEAYINGLTKRHNQGKQITNIKAVASFFLSRIDSAIDNKLPAHLQGKTAISLAKTAYLVYKDIFDSVIFAPLKASGAKNQYLLFASTGTKNPSYSDVMYVEELIGSETINTVPDATLENFRDHGNAGGTLNHAIENAPKLIDEIKKIVNLDELGEQLQIDGLKLFTTSFNDLIKLMQ